MSEAHEPQPPAGRTYTGYRRRRTTRPTVRLGDRTARILIGVGGIGTIAAVSLVLVFLVSVVVPLFRPEATTLTAVTPAPVAAGDRPELLLTDEYRVMGVAVHRDRAASFRMDTGEPLEVHPLFGGRLPGSLAYDPKGELLVGGFDDGTTQIARLEFVTQFLKEQDIGEWARDLEQGRLVADLGGLVERTPVGQLRLQRFTVTEDPAVSVFSGSRVELVDVVLLTAGPVVAALSADGTLAVNRISQRRNLLTGVVTTTLEGGSVPLDAVREKGLPIGLYLTGVGDNVYLIWRDGLLVRYDTRDINLPQVAERVALIPPESNATVTAMDFLIGKTTFLVGDSRGTVRSWFRIKPEGAPTVDGAVLAQAHVFKGPEEAVTALSVSRRKRMVAVGYANGEVRLSYVTSDQELSSTNTGARVERLAIAPKDDALLVLGGDGQLRSYGVDAPHPEITLSSLVRPVWYEGNVAPNHTWQSSSGSDDFEPKFGLVPLIFGTLKATFYSLLFGVPIALLAAIYTSEFLHPRLKSRIKPLIEMMASLPSVVLGFLAALVVAPFVEDLVPALLASIVLVPLLFLLSGYFLPLLPRGMEVRLQRLRLPLVALVLLPGGIALSMLLGPVLERLMFHGDLKLWLDGQVGDGAPGWSLLLLPFLAAAVAFLVTQRINPWLRKLTDGLSRRRAAAVELAKFLVASVVVVGAVWLVARLLVIAGLDSRAPLPLLGRVLGTFVQRNSLVVGFIMGFAIIPIIYTIADDALSTVPEHLRSASLAAGATPWQTTLRVVVPTAMSGLFSAVMIGLGRAVGETMIVLMAAGNTPVLEWNLFNGFRTLSANIAVELPEAVANSTHYRTLFLAALALFVMTFVVNTAAEVVRLRFRRRAYEL